MAQPQKDFERGELVATLDFADVRRVDATGNTLGQLLLSQAPFMAQALERETQFTSQRLLISVHVVPLLPVSR
jgi:hypothetical protein